MIFLDSSYIVAYYNENDENHDKAIHLMNELTSGTYGEFIISDYIFDEIVTVALIRLKELAKIKIGNDVQFFSNILSVEENVFDFSWDIFAKQKNTKFSFTDCSIIALMREYKIRDIATFDEDFKKIKEINVVN